MNLNSFMRVQVRVHKKNIFRVQVQVRQNDRVQVRVRSPGK